MSPMSSSPCRGAESGCCNRTRYQLLLQQHRRKPERDTCAPTRRGIVTFKVHIGRTAFCQNGCSYSMTPFFSYFGCHRAGQHILQILRADYFPALVEAPFCPYSASLRPSSSTWDIPSLPKAKIRAFDCMPLRRVRSVMRSQICL